MTDMDECYCCTCYVERPDHPSNPAGWSGERIDRWDPMCRNHGAHGVRACDRHGLPGQSCGCGCTEVAYEQPFDRGGCVPPVQVVPVSGMLGEQVITPDWRVFEVTAEGLVYRGFIALPPELDGETP